ncbi:hypothetical protein HDF12_004388 [Edaphobacter lichenicola]|uniref:Uncharacterized protein n=1 Tax=Tunturiibacter lichenicola TaxID=2051959 RepID=A0A7Y9NR38_9BACT|nr:hypothetical protein [Edaphobacter lichenicola]
MISKAAKRFDRFTYKFLTVTLLAKVAWDLDGLTSFSSNQFNNFACIRLLRRVIADDNISTLSRISDRGGPPHA